jgi:hypothetical protein
MAKFLTRVELHDAKWPDDFNTLQAAMKREGFSTTITSSAGVTYLLPTAEYYKISDDNLQTVIESVKRAAASTGKKFGAITGECNMLTWDGLTQV